MTTTEAYVIKFGNGKFYVCEDVSFIGQVENIIQADILDEEVKTELQFIKDHGGELGKTAEPLKITISYELNNTTACKGETHE